MRTIINESKKKIWLTSISGEIEMTFFEGKAKGFYLASVKIEQWEYGKVVALSCKKSFNKAKQLEERWPNLLCQVWVETGHFQSFHGFVSINLKGTR